jgi:hypothetical protein
MISIADLGLGAGLGGIVGIGLGAYLKGMFGEAGKIDAAASRLEDIGKRAFKEAFESEAGKRLASRQDVDNVLSEVRNVTRETESIKAQISGDTWLRQTVWVQKREAYAALLRCLNELENSCKALTFSLAILQRREAESEAYETQLGEVQKKREAVLDDLSQVVLHFDTAALFDPTISAQKKALAGGYGFEAAMNTSSTFDQTKLFVIGLMQFRRDLLSHMRKQLGVPDSK